MPARAVLFDFNGTLSDDEPIVCAIFQELFAERGLRCVAVLGTLPRERLTRANAIVERLDADAVREALS